MTAAQAALSPDLAEHYFDVGTLPTGTDDAAATSQNALAIGPGARASAVASVALGDHAMAKGLQAIAIGYEASASGLFSVAFGSHANATNTAALSLGVYSVAAADGATATGYAARAMGLDASAVGSNTEANGYGSAAFGAYALAATNGGVALGYSASAAVSNSVAAGPWARAAGLQSIAFGASATATATQSAAFGAGAFVSEANSVALGAGSIAASLTGAAYIPPGVDVSLIQGIHAVGQVSIGAAGNERRLTNVAAGANDTDAVNVSQLRALESQADGATAKLDSAVTYEQDVNGGFNRNAVTMGGNVAAGGTLIHNVANGVQTGDAVNLGQLNAAINGAVSNIAVNDPTVNPLFSADGDPDTEAPVSSGTHSVAAGANAQAFGASTVAMGANSSAGGNSATALGSGSSASGANAVAIGANSSASGNNATALGTGSNAGADNAVALGQGSIANRANTVSVGAAGQERQIANVAAGWQGTDAVNVKQLQQSLSGAVGQANGYTDDRIRSARRDAHGGTAAALAVAGLPQAVLPGRGMMALAGGTYGGQSALAIGVSQLSATGKWVYKVQGTTDSRGQFGASLGAGMHW